MTFFERYEAICSREGIKPMSEYAAQKIGVKRATISAWKKNSTTPKAETISAIAEAYGVSPDYLLGRTNDPVDYANPDLIAEVSGPVLDRYNGDVKKAVAFQQATAADAQRENMYKAYPILAQYEQLDEIDRMKVEAFIQGLLSHEKYTEG